MYIFVLWWENHPVLPVSCKCSHFMQLTAFIIQYEESLCYYMTVIHFSSTEVCSGVEINRSFIVWVWLYKFFLLLSFLCHTSQSHHFLLDLGPRRLFIPLMPFMPVLKAISLPLFKSLLLPRSLANAEAMGPSRAGAPKVFSLQSPSPWLLMVRSHHAPHYWGHQWQRSLWLLREKPQK